MKSVPNDLLDRLLKPLIDEWGRDAVLKSINNLQKSKTGADLYGADDTGRTRYAIEAKRIDRHRNTDALIRYIKSLDQPEEKTTYLLQIAEKIEDKSFLPKVGDMKNFLERHGVSGKSLKQRSDGFNKVVNVIISMPSSMIEELAKSDFHTGPARLGTISDAIKSAGENMRSNKNPTDDDDRGVSDARIQRSE